MTYNNLPTTDPVALFQLQCCESVYEALMSKCFIKALKPNIPLSPEIAKECATYCTAVLRNAGGIGLLTNAIESATGSKKSFLQRFNDACVSTGLQISTEAVLNDAMWSAIEDAEEDDVPTDVDLGEDEDDLDEYDDMDPDDIDDEPEEAAPEMPKEFKGKTIDQIQLDTKISEKELGKLKSAADKVDLDDISQIISDKVTNVIQAEKVQRYKLNEEKERIKQAIIDDSSNAIEDENAAESAMDTMLNVPLSRLDTGVYTTLFSTIQRRAIESTMIYENGNVSVADMLTELTVNNTMDCFHPVNKTFYDATSRAIEMSVITEDCDEEHMEKVINSATTFATIVYTMLEMLHTMNLNTCTPKDVKAVVTKNAGKVAPTNDVCNAINKNATAAIEDKKKFIMACAKKNDTIGLENAISDIKVIKGRLIQAKENVGLKINDSIMPQLDNLIDIASQKKAAIEAQYTMGNESASYDRVTAARRSDISRMDSIARALRSKNFDNIKFKCCESSGESTIFSVSAERGKTPVYKTELCVAAMESIAPEKYIKYLINGSKLKDVTPNNETPDYCVINKGQIHNLAE